MNEWRQDAVTTQDPYQVCRTASMRQWWPPETAELTNIVPRMVRSLCSDNSESVRRLQTEMDSAGRFEIHKSARYFDTWHVIRTRLFTRLFLGSGSSSRSLPSGFGFRECCGELRQSRVPLRVLVYNRVPSYGGYTMRPLW